MIIRWLLAAFHLLALGIGLGAVLNRAWALRGSLDAAGIRRVLSADTAWGVAALLWISTGLLRVFGGSEKGSAYYLGNHVFWTKMGLLVMILILEVTPMVTFMKWRTTGRNGVIDTGRAATLSRISFVQAVLVVLMVFAATAMARAIG
jgi:putative membrane protein